MRDQAPEPQPGVFKLAPDHFRRGGKPEPSPSSPRPKPIVRPMRQTAASDKSGPKRVNISAAIVSSQRAVVRAARWTTNQSVRLSLAIDALFRRRDPAEGELAELEEAARYAAVSNRLSALAPLSAAEAHQVRMSTPDRRIHQAGSDLVVEGDSAPRPMFIAKGWACRMRVSRSGVRHILGFLLPGDGIALRSAVGATTNTTVAALTAVETVDAQPVLEMAEQPEQNPGVSAAMHCALALEEEFLINHAFRIGAMAPQERVAHLLMELHWRLRQSGLATARNLPMPIQAETLGDALSMSPRAVERALRSLQRRNIIRRGYCQFGLLQGERMKEISGFAAPALAPRSNGRRLIVDASSAAWSPADVSGPEPELTPLPPELMASELAKPGRRQQRASG